MIDPISVASILVSPISSTRNISSGRRTQSTGTNCSFVRISQANDSYPRSGVHRVMQLSRYPYLLISAFFVQCCFLHSRAQHQRRHHGPPAGLLFGKSLPFQSLSTPAVSFTVSWSKSDKACKKVILNHSFLLIVTRSDTSPPS